jgi:hypothetical protein
MSEDKYSPYSDRELMIKLLDLLDKDAEKPAKPKKKRATKIPDSIEPRPDPIKSDINKMLEKPKKRRVPKTDKDEYGEIDAEIENAVPEPPRQTTFLEQAQEPAPEPIKQTITEKPVKERPKPAKLFKEDLLMTIDPNERKKAIQTTKNEFVSTIAQPIKEDQAKQNISKFLSTYSKNKKY